MQRILRRRDPGARAPEATAHPAGPVDPAHATPTTAPGATASGAATPGAAGSGVGAAGAGTAGSGEGVAGTGGGAAGVGSASAGAAGAGDAGTSAAGASAVGAGVAHPSAADAPPPAGVDPAAAAEARPSFRERGRLRRRLRFVRRLRELGFRDLGGLVFDQHRFGRPDDELVRGKLTALAAVDAELRALERALDDRRPITELREPGVSACARCGAVIASDARYCSSCGAPVGGARAIPGVGGSPGEEAPGTAGPAPPADEQPTVVTRPEDRPAR